MALLWRCQARWTGGQIGQGFTNLHFTAGISTAQLAMDATRAFFSTCLGVTGGNLPTGISIAFPAGVEELDDVDGQLVRVIPVTAPANVNGSDAAAYSAVSGGCVTWLTQGVIAGHSVQGRTFLVPLGASGYQTDGTLATIILSQFNSAAAALISAAPEFTIFRRPTTVAAQDGSSHPVLAQRVSDRAAILRSRR